MGPPIATATLAFDPSTGDKIRNPWYDVTCCPPNLERTFASLPGYFYSTSKDGVYAHLYDNSLLDWRLENETPLQIAQKTNYPWDGDVQLTVTPAGPADFTLFVRIPGWVKNGKVAVNGKSVDAATRPEFSATRGLEATTSVGMGKLRLTLSPAFHWRRIGKYCPDCMRLSTFTSRSTIDHKFRLS